MKTSKKAINTEGSVVAEAVAQEAVLEPVLPAPVVKPDEKVVQQSISIKHPIRLLLLVLLLGWIFDFLFWKQVVGVNFAILLALSLIVGLVVLISEGYRPGRKSLWLLVPFIFFAIITFIRRESLTVFLAYLFTLFTLALFATNYLGGRWYLYRLSDYFYKFLLMIVDMLARPFSFGRQISRESPQNKKALPISGVLRGLVIALPIVLCFGTLLASADVVFNQKLVDFFDTERISEYIQRFILIIVFAYLLTGTILHAATRSTDEKITEEKKSLIKPFLGFTESAVVLGSVIGLFLFFVIIQFQYFFGGQKNIGVAGYTYSQYARRGFNELVMVAFFSLVMIIILSTVTRRENEMQRRVYSGLSVAVVALVMIILVSSYQRISLAIGWHGYSRLRLYPRIFLIWLGILLITVVVLEMIRRERYFTVAALLAALGFAVNLTLFNVDAAIVKWNVYRS